jgi:hypothetical protein
MRIAYRPLTLRSAGPKNVCALPNSLRAREKLGLETRRACGNGARQPSAADRLTPATLYAAIALLMV